MLRQYVILFIASNVLLLAAGCRSKNNSQLQSLTHPLAKHERLLFKVCFLEPEDEPGPQSDVMLNVDPDIGFTDQQQQWTKQIISQQFTEDATGIHFWGWEACDWQNDNGKSHVLMIGRSLTGGGHTDLGAAEGGPANQGGRAYEYRKRLGNSNFVIYLNFDKYCSLERIKVSKEICTKGLALHEFGHFAGLRHEHAREEAKEDKLCQEYIDDPEKDPEFATGQGSSETFGFPYDSVSMMSYCYMDWYEERETTTLEAVRLTPTDRKTIRCLYGLNECKRQNP